RETSVFQCDQQNKCERQRPVGKLPIQRKPLSANDRFWSFGSNTFLKLIAILTFAREFLHPRCAQTLYLLRYSCMLFCHESDDGGVHFRSPVASTGRVLLDDLG